MKKRDMASILEAHAGKRLFIVRVVYEGMVLARDATEAEELADQIKKYDSPETESEPAGKSRASGWADDDLVYCDGPDITIADAERLVAEQATPRETDTRTIDMFGGTPA